MSKVYIVEDEIEGNAFSIKNQLKELKCLWNPARKKWTLTKVTDLVKVSEIINEFNAKIDTCEKCNVECKPGFKVCYICYMKK
jgi:hypothetical protein